jgi:hypothetical protein
MVLLQALDRTPINFGIRDRQENVKWRDRRNNDRLCPPLENQRA